MCANEALRHPFIELTTHRGLGNRINVDRHKAYMLRSKYQVSQKKVVFDVKRWI